MSLKNLIIPAAGKSSRFPGIKPKWLLTHPEGGIMVTKSLENIDLKTADRIYLGILRDHLDKFCSIDGIKSAFKKIGITDNLDIVILEGSTNSQPETVYEIIKARKISGEIFIKDVDSYFECNIPWGNSVATYDLNNMNLAHAKNKSYVTVGDNNLINNIVEKQVISSKFCVGGYGFKSVEKYIEYYNSFDSSSEFYISHIIFKMIFSGIAFSSFDVHNFIDWGTLHEWNRFKSTYLTLFVDIDGTLVENCSEFFSPKWGESGPLQENIDKINNLFDSGRSKVILTTSRKTESDQETRQQLDKLGVKYHQIIYDLYHAKRVIINDYAESNPYKSCDAINIRRNSSDLKFMIRDIKE